MTVKDSVTVAIDALKASPILLALVLLQFALLGLVGWVSHETRAHERARFELVLKQCGPVGPR